METKELITATLTTDCQCTYYEDETGDWLESPNCDGCGQWMLEDADYLLDAWYTRNGEPEAALISGTRLGWTRSNGYAIARGYVYEVLTKAILKKLTLDADFTLTLTLDNRQLTATRSSHDELRASFTVEPFIPCDGWSGCMALAENIKEYEGRNLCGICADIEGVN